MKIKNNRGDLSVTLLVIGVFAICSLALFSFFYSDFKIKNSLKTTNLMEQTGAVEEDIKLYENLDLGMISNLDYFNQEQEVEKNIFVKLSEEKGFYVIRAEYRIEKGFLFWKKTQILSSVEYTLKG